MWQPIETAPKDGSKFLGVHNGFIEICHWDEMDWVEGMTPMFFPISTITHWMPLPSPPEE